MRIRRTSVPALLLAVAALAAGCGGSEVPPDEVPGSPVTLTVPEDEELGGTSSSSADADGTTTDDTADDAATADDTATDPGAATDDTSGGTAAPAPADDGGAVAPAEPEPAPADEPAAAPDAGADGTSDFCEQNAGAC